MYVGLILGFILTSLTSIVFYDSDAGTGGPGGPLAAQYLSDHLTLFQPGRADYPRLLLLVPPMFFTFRHHCMRVHFGAILQMQLSRSLFASYLTPRCQRHLQMSHTPTFSQTPKGNYGPSHGTDIKWLTDCPKSQVCKTNLLLNICEYTITCYVLHR